ncbi:site-specific recombinase XerD (plasmid) [Synechococcus sp. PCC 7502]|uniref:tyrosine-type recombinase/integrase n=1 Tax=Synechococcus sp. PCC 7502 TaxID=1173263 RepID=UPI00029F89C6|nr:site-specific integrase [Synechococcus sp. PCC 7502]AFY75492.1 site-specific recombinase XerD [Synechococcus sp. PCC 7502]
MKVERNGQAEILTQEQLQEFFNYLSPKYRAIFAICLFSGCRISEALSLKTEDISNGVIVFRKSVTKGKLKTREIDINPKLQNYLEAADLPKNGYIFPSKRDAEKPMSSQAADEMLRKYCDYLGFEGVSTHSFRRTALTMMSASGIPLRTIQEISGHASLATLQRYLEVTPNQKKEAIAVIGF